MESRCVTREEAELPTPEFKAIAEELYPFAMVLRLRVIQVVCGITLVIMGTVAFIEDKGRVKMGLGMPAGIFTVLAAGGSIYTSRGFTGYKEPHCIPRLRFLGPRPSVAYPLTILWTAACAFLISVLSICIATLTTHQTNPQTTSLAWLLLGLSLTPIIAGACIVRVDCTKDPD